ncbi:MAG: YiiX/YebB-like N1pC/P60 family cysteine hydrolase [Alphaproteobacteria bacterium]
MLCGTLGASAPGAHAIRKAPELPPLMVPAVEAGDVVFIAVDRAFWSRAASRFSAHGFGHVGIAAHDEGGQLLIVHAGGSPSAGDAPVLAVPAEIFAREADRIAVYRPHASVAERISAGRVALDFVQAGAHFDAAFSLDTTDALYCSELVWRALSSALHRDIVPDKTWIVGLPGVSLADLERSPTLELVNDVHR